ncbi:2Fe-2S iron-sulfur cluster-binding protein [Chamaesiphon sp. VAR_69_metabat_338]|uniref:2Fe-2S iron-sulfur cluster-binding protein n=1 Tax=Chamaesiphon sp. VAR_69_metabat_338 TaxID=2964704 RepID=UPI00286DE63F|nr:2Fe-2S iron-sulfur cluster-binding protein [Chamaesiphon sp. VAR_69_metabat_338]
MTNSYQVRLFNKAEGIDQTVEVPADRYILETAEEQGMELPYSCRQGVCSTCTVKMIEGTVDQSEGTYLSEEQIAKGYVLICIAYPQANCVFETHKEEEVL